MLCAVCRPGRAFWCAHRTHVRPIKIRPGNGIRDDKRSPNAINIRWTDFTNRHYHQHLHTYLIDIVLVNSVCSKSLSTLVRTPSIVFVDCKGARHSTRHPPLATLPSFDGPHPGKQMSSRRSLAQRRTSSKLAKRHNAFCGETRRLIFQSVRTPSPFSLSLSPPTYDSWGSVGVCLGSTRTCFSPPWCCSAPSSRLLLSFPAQSDFHVSEERHTGMIFGPR